MRRTRSAHRLALLSSWMDTTKDDVGLSILGRRRLGLQPDTLCLLFGVVYAISAEYRFSSCFWSSSCLGLPSLSLSRRNLNMRFTIGLAGCT